jgi:hypothetical protein
MGSAIAIATNPTRRTTSEHVGRSSWKRGSDQEIMHKGCQDGEQDAIELAEYQRHRNQTKQQHEARTRFTAGYKGADRPDRRQKRQDDKRPGKRALMHRPRATLEFGGRPIPELARRPD